MPSSDSAAHHGIEKSPLYGLYAKRRLAQIIGISNHELRRLAKSIAKGSKFYSEWDDGETGRHIEHPGPPLKAIQSLINDLLMRIAPPDYLYCPARGRSQIMCAKAHASSEVIYSLDIKCFHPSTKATRVYWFFHHRMHCSQDVSAILTLLTTYKEHLPTGGPSSSALAFYAHLDMWEEIDNAVVEARCRWTVYGDDISISGTDAPEELMWRIKQIIHKRGLRYHKIKRSEGRIRISNKLVLNGELVQRPNRQHKKAYLLTKQIRTTANQLERKHLLRQLRGCLSHAKRVHAINRTS